MKKIILLTTALLSSISAYAVCTPPTTLKCNCAHPILENGVLACGASYCGDKKCMPDGSCCESEKYCEVGDNKYCCADGQTCDTTKGCVETANECNGKNDYTPCQNGNGYCYEEYCLTRGSLHSQCTQLVNHRNSLEYCESTSSHLSCYKDNEYMCYTFEGGDPLRIIEWCYTYDIRTEAEYEISQCPSGKGGICILSGIVGSKDEIANGLASSSEEHKGGVCVD